MSKISFGNKTNLYPVIDEEKQITAENINEIKDSVNKLYDLLPSTPGSTQYSIEFSTSSWVGATAPYSQTFLQTVHKQTISSTLSIITKEFDGAWYKDCNCDPKTNSAGDVVIYSQSKFNGLIVIGSFSGTSQPGHATSLTLTDTVTSVEYDIEMQNGVLITSTEI